MLKGNPPFLADTFEREFGPIFRTIFRATDSRQKSPFVNSDWPTVLLPEGLFVSDDDIFAALTAAVRATGDTEAIVTVVESIPPHFESLRTPMLPTWDQLCCRGTSIEHFDYAVFGKSATWGAMSYNIDFTRLAGDDRFIDIFLQRLGGIDRLKARFYEFAETGWRIKPEAKAGILNSVGW